MPSGRNDEKSRPAGFWRRAIPPLAAAGAAVALLASFPLDAGRDFFPQPDAAEYAWVARTFLDHHQLKLDIGGAAVPSRYPPGYPMLLAILTAIFRLRPAHLIYTSLGMAGLVVGLTFLLVRRWAGQTAAWLATFIVVGSPGFVTMSGRVMAEVPAALWAIVLLALWLRVRSRAPRGPAGDSAAGLGLGLLAGYGVLIRLPNVSLLVPYVLLAAVHLRRRGMRVWLLAFFGGLGVTAAVLLLLNQYLYGDPLESGYGYWFPSLYKPLGHAMNLRHLWVDPDTPHGEGALLAHLKAFLGLYGIQEMLVPPLSLILGVVGVFVLWRRGGVARDMAVITAGSFVALLLFCGVYRWPVARLLVPLVPLVALAAGIGWGALARRPRWELVAAIILGLGAAGQSVRQAAAVRSASPGSAFRAYRGLAAMSPRVKPGALILTDVLLPLGEFYLCPRVSAEQVPVIITTRGRHVWMEDHARQILNQKPELRPDIRCIAQRRWREDLNESSLGMIEGALTAGRQVLMLSGYQTGTQDYVADFEVFLRFVGERFRLARVGEEEGLMLLEIQPGPS